MKRVVPVVVVFAVCAASRPAAAQTCSFIGITGVNFGAYDVFDTTPIDSVGDITFRCTGVVPGDNVMIELGTGAANTFLPRTMLRGAEALGYNLYLDAARSVVFGNGGGGTSTYGPTTPPNDQNVTVTVYGRIPARQDVSAGAYADTVTVTMHF